MRSLEKTFWRQSIRFVANAAANPTKLKLNSYALHSAKPPITGTNDNITNIPQRSPKIIHARITVKNGAVLFTVSVKDTDIYFKAKRPKTTVVNLQIIYNYCWQSRRRRSTIKITDSLVDVNALSYFIPLFFSHKIYLYLKDEKRMSHEILITKTNNNFFFEI